MDNIFQGFYAFSQIPLKRTTQFALESGPRPAHSGVRPRPAPVQALREDRLSSWPARVCLGDGEVIPRICIHV